MVDSTFRPLILAQFKAYQSIEETLKSIENILKVYSSEYFEIYISLPYTFIETVKKKFENQNILFGVESISDLEHEFTASIAIKLLKNIGAAFVLIGTPQERKEAEKQLAKKVTTALEAQISPFICIGESLEEKHDHLSKEILFSQLKASLPNEILETSTPIHFVYNAEWISQTPWDTQSQELLGAYKNFKEVVNEINATLPMKIGSLILAIPSYSPELSTLLKTLSASNDFAGYSLGIVGLSSEFLQPISPTIN